MTDVGGAQVSKVEAPPAEREGVSRRVALTGVAGVGLAVPLLAACGGEEAAGSETPAAGAGPSVTDEPAPTSAVPEPSEPPSDAPADDGVPGALAPTADIPVGGGVIFADDRVVVTQPAAGEFRCFSAVCTHSGCIVAGVGASIVCTCHQSSFDLSTGEVLGGPAPAPLPAVDFTIEKNQVVLT
jgi:Rieske Fe-S protein